MNATTQRWCVWCGPTMLVLFMTGFALVAGMVPPISPALSADEVARFYIDNQTRIQLGVALTMVGAGFTFPWAVVISLQIKRAERRWGPLSLLQLLSGGVFCLLIVFPLFAMAAAAYRPESRSAELTQALNDLAWLPFIGFVAPPCVQVIAIGVAAFADRRPAPVFPRWVGYFNIWCAVLFLPGVLVIFFTTGPFAWNGIFAFWIGLTVLGAWFFVMVPQLLRAIEQQEREEAVGDDAAKAELA